MPYKALFDALNAAHQYMNTLGTTTHDIMGNTLPYPTPKAAPLYASKMGVEASFPCHGQRYHNVALVTGNSFLAGNDIDRVKIFEVELNFDDEYNNIISEGIKICPSLERIT